MSAINHMAAAVNPLDARRLGSIEVGLYRNRRSGPFSRAVHSISGKLLKTSSPKVLCGNTVAESKIQHHGLKLLNHEFDEEFIDCTMQQLLLDCEVPRSAQQQLTKARQRTLLGQAMQFDPINYLDTAVERSGKFDANGYRHWKIVMTALGLPGGKNWLIKQGACLPKDSGQIDYLVNVARSCLQIEKEKGWFPDVINAPVPTKPDSEKSIAELAGDASLAGLSGDRQTLERLAWSVNALRNHLDPVGRPAEFAAINDRLLKVGVWARRCGKPGVMSRVLPMLKKSPFRALRFGLMGADQADGNQPRLVGKNAQPKQICSIFHHLIDRMEGASRLKLFDGGRLGINTKGVGVVLTSLVAFFVFHLKFGLLALRLRTAGIEIAMPPYNMELMIYSTKGGLVQAGLGAALGPEFGLAQATVGGEFNPLIREQQRSKGIVLRMPRVRGHEEQLRTRFKSMISDLLEWSAQPEFQTTTASGELLKKLMGKYSEMSVSEIGHYTQKKRGMSAGVEASLALNAGEVRFSATADTKLEITSRMRRLYEDSKGAIRVTKRIVGRQLKAFSGVELGVRSSFSTDDARYNAPSLLGWGRGVDWLSGSREARREVVYNDGSLHGMSFMEVQFQSFKDFNHSVLNNLDNWVETRAAQKKTDIKTAKRQIMDFLGKVEAERSSTRTYAIRAEVKPEVARKVDQMNALIQLLNRRPIKASPMLAASLTANVEAILDHPLSYEPTSFRVFERHDHSQYRGLHFALNSHSATGAEGVHAQARLM